VRRRAPGVASRSALTAGVLARSPRCCLRSRPRCSRSTRPTSTTSTRPSGQRRDARAGSSFECSRACPLGARSGNADFVKAAITLVRPPARPPAWLSRLSPRSLARGQAYGKGNPLLAENKVAAVQSLSGTGALRLSGAFLNVSAAAAAALPCRPAALPLSVSHSRTAFSWQRFLRGRPVYLVRPLRARRVRAGVGADSVCAADPHLGQPHPDLRRQRPAGHGEEEAPASRARDGAVGHVHSPARHAQRYRYYDAKTRGLDLQVWPFRALSLARRLVRSFALC
jgi:hypothetical protein